ncbi:MAG TPA: sulfotransferase domain-containing protein [Mycobacteriales bacterium]|nr:sulfotransferase domain-containing protein [Mycobacteriales bacterium]
MRHYRGFMADSSRWERFPLRADDIVISTPSKCGTTWMQTIVGMLVLGRTDLGPLSELSPWLDMQIEAETDVFARLAAQDHRRWIKTHTPLDGLPVRAGVTYLAVARHPLDVALSDLDHGQNMDGDRARALRGAVVGEDRIAVRPEGFPDDPAEHLRWFIDNDLEPCGSGPYGLADYCQQIGTFWERRHRPGVHLFHYQDLWDDLDGEMRRVAAALGIDVDESTWPEVVAAATLDAMRARASEVVPNANAGLWRDDRAFFRQGGRRHWGSLLSAADVEHFHARLDELAGPAAGWVLEGRRRLD